MPAPGQSGRALVLQEAMAVWAASGNRTERPVDRLRLCSASGLALESVSVLDEAWVSVLDVESASALGAVWALEWDEALELVSGEEWALEWDVA